MRVDFLYSWYEAICWYGLETGQKEEGHGVVELPGIGLRLAVLICPLGLENPGNLHEVRTPVHCGIGVEPRNSCVYWAMQKRNYYTWTRWRKADDDDVQLQLKTMAKTRWQGGKVTIANRARPVLSSNQTLINGCLVWLIWSNRSLFNIDQTN